jgi:hypothetical protein
MCNPVTHFEIVGQDAHALLNSIAISAATVLLGILVNSMAAFALPLLWLVRYNPNNYGRSWSASPTSSSST